MIRSDKQHIKNENIQNRIILYLIDNNIYLKTHIKFSKKA